METNIVQEPRLSATTEEGSGLHVVGAKRFDSGVTNLSRAIGPYSRPVR